VCQLRDGVSLKLALAGAAGSCPHERNDKIDATRNFRRVQIAKGGPHFVASQAYRRVVVHLLVGRWIGQRLARNWSGHFKPRPAALHVIRFGVRPSPAAMLLTESPGLPYCRRGRTSSSLHSQGWQGALIKPFLLQNATQVFVRSSR